MGTELQVTDSGSFKMMSPEVRKQFLADMQNFTTSLNAKPTKVVTESINGKNITYVPISVIEKDLDKVFFGMVQFEILWSKQVLNEFEVAARVKVFHPIMMQWLNYDGIGAALIQQKSGTQIIDFHVEKLQTALKLAAPNAYAEAIKNAAKKIGKRFGSDLMRKIEDDYTPYNISDKPAHKVVPEDEQETDKNIDKPTTIKAIKTKADLVRAYAQNLVSTAKYNELLSGFQNKTQMP
jgi:hypothetical protein